MSNIPSETWVEIEQVILTPAQRAPGIPDDTRATPYVRRISGFLTAPAVMGGEATIRTMIGRTMVGTLRVVNPSYSHSFGETVPELLKIGLGGQA